MGGAHTVGAVVGEVDEALHAVFDADHAPPCQVKESGAKPRN